MHAPNSDAKLICLTPVRNEAWVLERFLQCASLWADHIVIADQMSDDGSRQIAARFPKAILVDNPASDYNEGERHRLLFERARQIPAARRIMLAIDADEVISANWQQSEEWTMLRSARPGTAIRFDWVNILDGFEKCWIPTNDYVMGFVDDGVSSHTSGRFHVPRLPTPDPSAVIKMRDVKVLHYQYTDWERMKSKQRGYQCSERLNNPNKRPIPMYRQYHIMNGFAPQHIHPMQDHWLAGYERRGIDMRNVKRDPHYRWDRETIEKLLQHGSNHFRKLDVWDRDWDALAKQIGIPVHNGDLKDPRTPLEKRVHRWLEATQPRCHQVRVRAVQNVLRFFGW